MLTSLTRALPFDVATNSSMRPVLERVVELPKTLPPALERVRRGGLLAVDDRIFLGEYAQVRLPVPNGMDAWSAERWVNDVSIDSSSNPNAPAWRPEILALGLALASALFIAATNLEGMRKLQISVSLQSAEGQADPEAEFAAGALHLWSLRQPSDDLRDALEDFAQPVAILTPPMA